MTVLAALAGVALAAWLWVVLARGMFWRTHPRLPAAAPAAGPLPSVAAVVPARDEADQLPATLPSLLGQRYDGRFDVVLVDDRSADGTGAAARRLGERAPRRPLVVEGTEPPAGWVGKVWAMATGVRAAPAADYLLFTDADIAHAPDVLARLVAVARRDDRDLVSVMATLRAENGWERLVVPAFVYFFALLYPFRWVGLRRSRTAAAAGGCVLVRRDALERAGGLAAIRGALIDDVGLARLLRGAGGRLWLGLSADVRSVRPYPGLGPLWRMVARSAYTQLRYSPLLLAGTALGLLLLFAVPPAAVVAGAAAGGAAGTWALAAGAVAWALQAGSYLPMLRFYGLHPARALSLPLAGLLYLAMTLDSARLHRRGETGRWKGRVMPAG